MSAARQKKENYFAKLIGLFQEYPRMFLVDVDMVGSKQLQDVRMALRGKGEMLMGKNTLIRKCLRDNLEEFPQFEELIPVIGGNTGFIFFNTDFSVVQDVLKAAFVSFSFFFLPFSLFFSFLVILLATGKEDGMGQSAKR